MKEPKLKTVYVCSNCGETSPRWMGRCPSCGSWNTMNEDVVAGSTQSGPFGQQGGTGPAGGRHLVDGKASGRYQYDRGKRAAS